MYNNTKADRISFVLLNSKVDQCVVVGGGCARTLRALAAIVYMYKFKSKSVVFSSSSMKQTTESSVISLVAVNRRWLRRCPTFDVYHRHHLSLLENFPVKK